MESEREEDEQGKKGEDLRKEYRSSYGVPYNPFLNSSPFFAILSTPLRVVTKHEPLRAMSRAPKVDVSLSEHQWLALKPLMHKLFERLELHTPTQQLDLLNRAFYTRDGSKWVTVPMCEGGRDRIVEKPVPATKPRRENHWLFLLRVRAPDLYEQALTIIADETQENTAVDIRTTAALSGTRRGRGTGLKAHIKRHLLSQKLTKPVTLSEAARLCDTYAAITYHALQELVSEHHCNRVNVGSKKLYAFTVNADDK